MDDLEDKFRVLRLKMTFNVHDMAENSLLATQKHLGIKNNNLNGLLKNTSSTL